LNIYLNQLKKIKDRISETEKITCKVEFNAHQEFEKAWKLGLLNYLKLFYGIFHLFFFRIDNRIKYIFHTPKHQSLIELFNQNEVLVISGNNHKNLCKELNYNYFIYFGFLESIIVAKKYNLNFIATIYMYLFNRKTKNRKLFFFLYEDVLPIGAFLSLQIRSKDSKIIMIQHGYASKKSYLYESNECDFYFLYDIKKIRRFASKEKCIEIGLPFEASITTKFQNNIILVGTGLSGVNQSEYIDSLLNYTSIIKFVDKAYKIKYRPHPCENVHSYINFGFDIDQSNKNSLLSQDLKIFIGYESTLLYEAKLIGHICIYLVKNNTIEIDYDVDLLLNESDLKNLEFILPIIIKNRESQILTLSSQKSLKNRFLNAIDLIA
jgi:hypothetical protein